MSIFVTGVINCLTCHLPASAAASDLAVAGRLQAEGRPLHRAQRSGQQHLPYQTGHQRQRHGGHGGQDAGQGPADQHQTAVREQPERRLAQPHRMSSGAERLVGAIHALCVCVCRTVVWDRNSVSPQGLQDVAAALEKYESITVGHKPRPDSSPGLRTIFRLLPGTTPSDSCLFPSWTPLRH